MECTFRVGGDTVKGVEQRISALKRHDGNLCTHKQPEGMKG